MASASVSSFEPSYEKHKDKVLHSRPQPATKRAMHAGTIVQLLRFLMEETGKKLKMHFMTGLPQATQ